MARWWQAGGPVRQDHVILIDKSGALLPNSTQYFQQKYFPATFSKYNFQLQPLYSVFEPMKMKIESDDDFISNPLPGWDHPPEEISP